VAQDRLRRLGLGLEMLRKGGKKKRKRKKKKKKKKKRKKEIKKDGKILKKK